MTVIAHTGDLHLGHRQLNYTTDDGQNQRQADFEEAAIAVAHYLAEEKPDVVVVAGDLLNETNVALRAMNGAVRFCQIIKDAGIPLIAIGGNHDEAEAKGRYNGLRFLADHHGLDLINEQQYRDIADVRIHGVPYRTLSRSERSGKALEPFNFADDKFNILLAHGYHPGTGVPDIPHDQELLLPSDWLEDERFGLVCLGHVHVHEKILPHRPVYYCGSTERRNFGEAEQRPAIWMHDSQGESRSVFLDEISSSPRPMIVKDIDTSGMTSSELDGEVNNLLDDLSLEGAMLRLRLLNVSAELDRSRARDVWRRRFRDRGGFYLDAITQTRRIRELLDIEFAAPPVDLGAALREFIDEQPFADDGEKERITDLADEIYSEAQESVVDSRTGGE